MRAQLLEAEAVHFSKKEGFSDGVEHSVATSIVSTKRQLEAGAGQDGDFDEEIEAKRLRVLEETRDIDAESDGSSNGSSDEDR